MTTVYMLYHEYESSPGVDEIKLIGVYSTQENAEAAAKRVRHKPGFRDRPNNFNIYDTELDRDGWVEGFGPD